MSGALEVEGLHAGYGRLEVLHGVDLSVASGTLHVVTGPNGSGKTTLLASLIGSVRPTAGHIRLGGESTEGWSMAEHRRRGIAYVPEGRGLFPRLTVRENLRVAAHVWGLGRKAVPARIETVVELFPAVGEKMDDRLATLSGGQQQQVSIARAMLLDPLLLLMDEPSSGLSPIVWHEVVTICRRLADEGRTVVMVEQRLLDVVDAVDRYSILRQGRVVREGDGGVEMLADPEVRRDYLAVGPR